MRNYVKKISQKIPKLSREQLEELLNNLINENENLYSIMDSFSTGLLILNNDFLLLQNNKIVESQIKFSSHLDNLKDSELPIWELIDDSDIAEYLKKCADKEITNSTEEFSTLTSGGLVRFLQITINPLVIKSNLDGRIILIRDITDKKHQDVIVHRMENMANLTNLAAGMAHEIKNPLGAISIHLQLINKAVAKARENQDILPGKKFVEDHIDVIGDEIDHLNKLVMDFLFAVRPVNATLQLKNPAKLIQNCVDFFEAEFNRFNIEVNLNLSESNTKILLDEKLFRDVIMNISQNSLAAIKSKFSECNQESLAKKDNYLGYFEISTYLKDSKYIIAIKDNGCGMSSETLQKLFEPYYTTKANGTGLGMTMVYKIIKEFAGDISVESNEGQGTAFNLSFPLPQSDKKLLSEGE
ncbi:MAG: two-component sensor histidine kinase [Treponema sp.]|nr:two-component sensor histidine kinase [Treponema sp.]